MFKPILLARCTSSYSVVLQTTLSLSGSFTMVPRTLLQNSGHWNCLMACWLNVPKIPLVSHTLCTIVRETNGTIYAYTHCFHDSFILVITLYGWWNLQDEGSAPPANEHDTFVAMQLMRGESWITRSNFDSERCHHWTWTHAVWFCFWSRLYIFQILNCRSAHVGQKPSTELSGPKIDWPENVHASYTHSTAIWQIPHFR